MIPYTYPDTRKSVSYLSINSVKHRESIIKNSKAQKKHNSKSLKRSKSLKGKKLPAQVKKGQLMPQYAEDNYVIVNGTIKADISRTEKGVAQILKLLLPNINNDEKISIFGKNLRNKRVIFSNVEAMKVVWKCILGQGYSKKHSKMLLNQLIKSFIEDPQTTHKKGNTRIKNVRHNSSNSHGNSNDTNSFSSNSYQNEEIKLQLKDATEIDEQLLHMKRQLIDVRVDLLKIMKSNLQNLISQTRSNTNQIGFDSQKSTSQDSILMRALRVQIWKTQKILFAKKICGIQEHNPRRKKALLKQQAKAQSNQENLQGDQYYNKIFGGNSNNQSQPKLENQNQQYDSQQDQKCLDKQLKFQSQNQDSNSNKNGQNKSITVFLEPPYPPYRTNAKEIISNFGQNFYKRKASNFIKYKKAIRSTVAKRLECMPQCHYCRKLFTYQEFFKCNNIPRQKASQSTFQTDPYIYHRVFYSPQLSTDYTSLERYVHPYYLYYRDDNGCRACNRSFCKQCFSNYIEPLQINKDIDKNQMVCSYCVGTCACDCCFKIAWIVRAMAFYLELNGNLNILKRYFLFPPRIGSPLIRVQIFQYEMRKFQTKRVKKERKAIAQNKDRVICKMHNPQALRQLVEIPKQQFSQLRNKYREQDQQQKIIENANKVEENTQKQLKTKENQQKLKPKEIQCKKLTLQHFKFQKKKRAPDQKIESYGNIEKIVQNDVSMRKEEQLGDQTMNSQVASLPKRPPQISTHNLVKETKRQCQNIKKYSADKEIVKQKTAKGPKQVTKLLKEVDKYELQHSKGKLKVKVKDANQTENFFDSLIIQGNQLQIHQNGKSINQNSLEADPDIFVEEKGLFKSISQRVYEDMRMIDQNQKKNYQSDLKIAKKSGKSSKIHRKAFQYEGRMQNEPQVIQISQSIEQNKSQSSSFSSSLSSSSSSSSSQSSSLSDSDSSIRIIPMIDLVQSSSN